MRLRLATAFLLALALAASTGCSQVKEALAPGSTVVTQEATVAVAGASVTGDMAPGLPEGVPLWPGARVTYSAAANESYNLTLVTADLYDDVLAGLATGFREVAWDVTQDESGAPGARSAVLPFSGPTAAGILTVTEAPNGTVGLAYVVTPAE